MKQAYHKYTSEDYEVWKLLYERQMNQLTGLAEHAYLDGIRAIGFQPNVIPRFTQVNEVLMEYTGWSLEVVKGLIDNKLFFELLQNKRFPASTWFRKKSELDYLEEPDMFHDVFGHVPLLTNNDFVNFLQGLSEIALRHIEDEWVIELISRLYWYTVEFGLINTQEGLRIYGAGILSSSGESVYSLYDKRPKRYPFDVAHIMSFPYIKDHFQEQYFVIDSYRQLYDSVGDIEEGIQKVTWEQKRKGRA